ncbi:hemicentin-1 isoform X2 [Esox lucius]|uniref:hemicentin-1 isoform X2 n=1 Tax=Esox lucius TaxID=8010 RepID=UPI001476ABE2|nr:hemicentin-1 isoform X2 [Esox lucius]
MLNMTVVNRNNTGWYRCVAQNKVNQERSDRIWIDVIYGPDVPQIDVIPYTITDRGYSAVERQTVSLLCQAESNPPCQYVWFYNNSQVYTGPQYTISRILRIHTGTYACQAQNTYLNTRSMKTISLIVYYPPEGSPSCSVLPAMNSSSLNLTCSWTGGLPSPSLHWTRDLLTLTQEWLKPGDEGAWPAEYVSVLQSGTQTSNNTLFTCLGTHPALNTTTQCTARAWSPSGGLVCSANATSTNQHLLLSCSWQGGSPRAVVWWEVLNGDCRGQGVETSNILVPRSNSTQNGQAYTCYAKHPLDRLTRNCSIVPVSKPYILLSDTSPEEGSSVWLRCGLENGTGPLYYLWEHETNSGLVDTVGQGNSSMLNMTVVNRNNTGWYRCVAQNQVNQERSDRIWMDVIYGPDVPQIDVTPYRLTDRGYTAVERQTVSLLCQAQSNPPSQYVWFYNNSQVYTGPQYTISRILRMHTGTYACQAQNTYLNTRSMKTISLIVYYPPEGSPSCSVLPAMNSSSLNLTCSWTGGLPSPSLHWTRDLLTLTEEWLKPRDEGAWPAEYVSVLQSGSQTSNNTLFTCLGTHPALNTSTQCTARAWSPSGGLVCSANATSTNQHLLLSCSWQGGSPRAVVWWEVPNGDYRGQGVETSNILVPRSNSTQNGQAYTCYAKHPLDRLTRNCSLVPVSKPYILLSDTSPEEGSSVWLRCGLENGTGPLYFLWERETNSGLVETVSQGNSNMLNMTVVNRNNTGWYRCVAQNQVNQERSDRIWMDVIYGPDVPQIDVSPYNITDRGYSAVERQTVSLLCQAQANPPSQYVWFYNNSQVYTGPQFTITRILRIQTGTYACLAQNTYLNTRSMKTISLTVYYPPEGSPSCSVLPAMNSSSLNLTCSWTGGLPSPSLHWTRDLLTLTQRGAGLWDEGANHVSVLQPGSQTSNNTLFTCLGTHPALNTPTQCTARAWSPNGEPVCSAFATRNNEYLLLSCSWEGGSPRAVVWWEGPKGEGSTQGVETANILVLHSNSTKNGQAYICYAKHPLDTLTRTCKLTLEAPVLLTQRSMVSVFEGNDVQLTCILHANYPPADQIVWLNNRRQEVEQEVQEALATRKYVLRRAAAWANLTVLQTDGKTDSGQYWCSANNAVGGTEIPVTLLVKRYPMPPNVTLVRLVYRSRQRLQVELEWQIKGEGEGGEGGGLTGFILERRLSTALGRRGEGEDDTTTAPAEQQELLHEKRGSSSPWQQVAVLGAVERAHTMGNMTPTDTYQIRITAVNHRTLGHPSPPKTPVFTVGP